MDPEFNLIEIETGVAVVTGTEAADLFVIPLAEDGIGITIIHGFELGIDALRFGRSLGPDGTAVSAEVAAAAYGDDLAGYAESWIDADGDGAGDDLLILAGANAVILSDLAAQIAPVQESHFHRGFEHATGGWIDESQDWFGSVTRVASGTDGIVSAAGKYHVVIAGDEISAPYNNLIGLGTTAFAPFTASVEIYLDSAADGSGWAAGQGFDYTVAASVQGLGGLDFYFNVAQDASTGALWLAAGTAQNPGFSARTDLEEVAGAVAIEADGWYRFAHRFHADSDGTLAVDMLVTNGEDEIVFKTTLTTDVAIEDVSGDPRYAYFELIDVAGGIAVDELDVSYDTGALPPLPELAGLFLA